MIGTVLLFTACEKIEDGYMSENVYYTENPFVVEQGSTTYSHAMELDLSTTPVYVDLLDIRNVENGETEEKWYDNSLIPTWTGVPAVTDTTIDMLKAKYEDAEYPIFNVNHIGGRLEFSMGTKDVPLGEYEIDVVVENTREIRYIYNACNIQLVEPTTFVTGAIDGNADETGDGGTNNASNFILLSSSGGSAGGSYGAPYMYYTFMGEEERDHMAWRIDSVICAQGSQSLEEDRDIYLTACEDGENSYASASQFRNGSQAYILNPDFGYLFFKVTDADRTPFMWRRQHDISYTEITSYSTSAGDSEVRPVFSGYTIGDWRPFDTYSPWLRPIYCGEYMICVYPVTPFPVNAIQGLDMQYARYFITADALDCNGDGGQILVNFQVGIMGYCIAEMNLHTSWSSDDYSGKIYHK